MPASTPGDRIGPPLLWEECRGQSRPADEVDGLSLDDLSPDDWPPDRGLSDLLLDSDLLPDPVFSLEPDFSPDWELDPDVSDDPFDPPESVELELLARESVT